MGNKPNQTAVERDLLQGLYLAVGYWDMAGPKSNACWQDLHRYVYTMLEKYDPKLYEQIVGPKPRRER